MAIADSDAPAAGATQDPPAAPRFAITRKPLVIVVIAAVALAILQWAGFVRLQAVTTWLESGRDTRSSLEAARAALARVPLAQVALAAEATQEGHWRFVNRAGETLTAGTPEEMQRLAGLLLPGVEAGSRVTLLVTFESLLERRPAMKDLPRGMALRLVMGGESYPVLGAVESEAAPLFIEVRPKVLVEARDAASVRETVWQLLRPIEQAGVRVLALETGGPSTLAPRPRNDPTTRRPMIDVIDPLSLAGAMGGVRGQTMIVTGRVESGILYVQPASGRERGVLVKDLVLAADNADTNLVVLQSASTPRQPGGRNWFWQRVEVKGLEQGLTRTRLVDLLDAVAGAGGRLVARAKADGATRTHLSLRSEPGLPAPAKSAPVSDLLLDAMGDITGRVVTTSVEASMRSQSRQREIDRRILPAVPSLVQAGYALLLLAGLAALPLVRTWWSRIWPAERREDYAGRAGYEAARVIRGGVFLLLFLPVAAVLAVPQAIARLVGMSGRGHAAGQDAKAGREA